MTNNTITEVKLSQNNEKWIRLMADWRESGKSVKEWVDQQDDITYDQFMNARKLYFQEDIRKNEFMEKETEWSSLSIEIPSSTLDIFIQDCRIEVTPGFDQDLLREVLEVIRHEN